MIRCFLLPVAIHEVTFTTKRLTSSTWNCQQIKPHPWSKDTLSFFYSTRKCHTVSHWFFTSSRATWSTIRFRQAQLCTNGTQLSTHPSSGTSVGEGNLGPKIFKWWDRQTHHSHSVWGRGPFYAMLGVFVGVKHGETCWPCSILGRWSWLGCKRGMFNLLPCNSCALWKSHDRFQAAKWGYHFRTTNGWDHGVPNFNDPSLGAKKNLEPYLHLAKWESSSLESTPNTILPIPPKTHTNLSRYSPWQFTVFGPVRLPKCWAFLAAFFIGRWESVNKIEKHHLPKRLRYLIRDVFQTFDDHESAVWSWWYVLPCWWNSNW